MHFMNFKYQMELYNLNLSHFLLKLIYEAYNGVVETHVFEEKIPPLHPLPWERNLFIKIPLKSCTKSVRFQISKKNS